MAYKIPAVSAISNQFPEFVKEDYPRFIRFVELYYEFVKKSELQGVGESFDSIRDVDVTLDKFIDSLWKEFGINVPKTNVANDIHFLKHIKDFYSTKGSEESFRILFRHLFNTEIEIKYPQEYIFKASDGKWIQDVSFLVSVTNGDIYDIVGQQVTIFTDIQKVSIVITRVRALDGMFEVYTEPFVYTDISYGNTLSFNNVVATIEKTITKVDVDKKGAGFYLGQMFTIPSATGIDAKIKVTKIGTNGSLERIEIINFGTGYQNTFYATITSKLTESVPSEFPTIKDQTLGFVDSGFITMDTYFENNIVNPSYSGQIISEFYNSFYVDTSNVLEDINTAIIQINIGTIRKYQGYYASDNGFLSNQYKLQDSYYYQIYSYVLSCVESINTYRDIVKTLVHPTGMKLFGEQVFTNVIPLVTSLEILNLFLQVSAQDEVLITDNDKPLYFLNKNISHYIDVLESKFIEFRKGTIQEEPLIAADVEHLVLDKQVSEILSLTETNSLNFIKPLVEELSEEKFFYWDISFEDSNYTTREIPALISFDKQVQDLLTLGESETLSINKQLSEFVSLTDNENLSLSKYLTDVLSIPLFIYWDANYENSEYISTEAPPIISYQNFNYNITLTN